MLSQCEVSFSEPFTLAEQISKEQHRFKFSVPKCAQTRVDCGCECAPHVAPALRLQLGVQVDARQ